MEFQLSIDDRKKFEENKISQSKALGKDKHAFASSKETLLVLDKYDYSYLWSWMGVPIIQLPADVMATQEVIWQTKPDIIIETGVARGGSVIFMASILEMIGSGQVIGVDVDIRAHNRETIEEHPMSKRISLIEGGSTDLETLEKVKALIPKGASVMVVLDSDHSYEHVLQECRFYGDLVTNDCFLVVADTLVGHIEESEAPQKRARILHRGDDPLRALNEYLSENDRFEVDEVINGKLVLSSSPGGYCRCLKTKLQTKG